jgi:hypothetical protein
MPTFLSMRVAIFSLLLAVAWAPALSFSARQFTETEQQHLIAGQALVEVKPSKGSTVLVTAAIDMPAPREIVWQVITDCKNSSAFMPYVRSCRILNGSAGGHEDVREFVGDLGFLVPSIRSVVRSGYDKPRRISFLAIGGDFTELSGEWRLESVDGDRATRVTYQARIAIPRLIPLSFARDAIEADVPQTLIRLRNVVISRRRAGTISLEVTPGLF